MKSNACSGESGDWPLDATSPVAAAQHVDTAVLLEFLFRLGQAYLACGEQSPKVELQLRRIATAYGMRKARVWRFPPPFSFRYTTAAASG